MQVFILQYFTRIVKNLKKRENTENLCLLIRGSLVQVQVREQKSTEEIQCFFSFIEYLLLNLPIILQDSEKFVPLQHKSYGFYSTH